MEKQRSNVPEEEKQQSKIPIYVTILLIAALIAGYFIWAPFKNFVNEAYQVLTSNNEQRISEWVGRFDFWGPFLIIFLMIVQMFLFVIPSALVMIVCILAYGPIWGSLLTILGVFVASSLGYAIGAYLGPVTVYKLIGKKTEEKIEDYIDSYGFWTVIIARISPILSNDATSFVGGLLRMGYWKFMGATLIGIIPLTLAIAYLGENFERLKSGLIWISAISFAILIGYIIYDKVLKSDDQ
ncbi:TVP38/TMEM64 family protein [Portibacter marinus]|uniref:TVP38/TMEM64 family protein n=1 Tax=Portibacter marinus TaxID=2898660 RepID=UPI001F1E7219|nr:TVP38/TMEM64 family protein [Portibacter marinus]